ncbi:SOS response-associated peptidase [Pseudomonas multiresinivorans]|uniref:SOS response-associated peptidase n=1 Tax=Pseudomonas multiresinivorans TaxID=95301 RepID=UPI0023FA1A53|nr:SOS response-associated peptidase family protein [Pseudomonas multiresinivorans]
MERYWHIGRGNSGRWIDRAYNVAPTSQVPMVLLNEAGEQEVVAARWGLIPFWWKKDKLPALTFNARSEEAATKPMWRDAIRHKRCLMPAAGWYEWNEKEPVKNSAGRAITPSTATCWRLPGSGRPGHHRKASRSPPARY